jgi:hypothetical protein
VTFIEAVFTEQMPFVGTKRQRSLVEAEARRDSVSRAAVVRRALDRYFDQRFEELAEFMTNEEISEFESESRKERAE